MGRRGALFGKSKGKPLQWAKKEGGVTQTGGKVGKIDGDIVATHGRQHADRVEGRHGVGNEAEGRRN